MRIQTWTRGLAACILGFAKAGNGQTVFQPRSTDGKITFNMDTWQFPGLFKDKAMLIWFKDASTQIVVAYLKNENQTAIAVAKAADDDQANYVDSGSEVRRAIIPTFASGPFTLDQADLGGNNTTGSITLTMDHEGGELGVKGAVEVPLYLQLNWTDGDTTGTTFSPYFAISRSGSSTNLTDLNQALSVKNNNQWSPAYAECIDSACTAPVSGTQTADPISTGTKTASATSSNEAAASTPSSDSTSSQGLSIGAVAGIAVACAVVGLLLIGAAVWFLCLRRRRTSHATIAQRNGYTSDGMQGMVDKEMPHVMDSPHSAFAQDRSQFHGPLEVSHGSMGGAAVGAGTGLMASAGQATHGGEDGSYAPYSDQTPPAGIASRGLGGEPGAAMDSQTSLPTTSARSPTPPVTRRYAHLVEEGMTDEDIRRLEEEERELDVAIKDAVRTRSCALD